MATTIHEPPSIGRRLSGGRGRGGRTLAPADGRLTALQPRPEAARTGVWVGLAAITMTFAGLTSAMMVRQGTSNDWQHLALPPILYLNTAMLWLSSGTLELSRSRVAAYFHIEQVNRRVPMLWLTATLLLGFLFVGGQYMAWNQLRQEGLYLATNPNSSFFYVFTAIHALHVLGGLGGLLLVMVRFLRRTPSLRRSTLDSASYYWHFMGVLWLYLFILLRLKL